MLQATIAFKNRNLFEGSILGEKKGVFMKFKIFFISWLSVLFINIYGMVVINAQRPMTRIDRKNQIEYSGPMAVGGFMTATRTHLYGDKYNYIAIQSDPNSNRADLLTGMTAEGIFKGMEEDYFEQHPEKRK